MGAILDSGDAGVRGMRDKAGRGVTSRARSMNRRQVEGGAPGCCGGARGGLMGSLRREKRPATSA